MKRVNVKFQVSFLLLLLGSCSEIGEKKSSLFQILNSDNTGITFQNTILENQRFNPFVYEYTYNGGGVAIGDVNDDGLDDIFFTGNMVQNELYLNQGNLKFKNITKASKMEGNKGWATGTNMVDINNDGLLDVYVCKSGPFEQSKLLENELYINMGLNNSGIPIFKEVAKEYGLNSPTHSIQSAFLDYDLDGDLDMYLMNHHPETFEFGDTHTFSEYGDKFFVNENGKYVDKTKETKIFSNAVSYGLGVGVSDLNNDGWPDIYISNDYDEPDYLYINQKNGTFEESIKRTTNHISHFSMGNDIADFDNDSFMDIMTLDMASAKNYDIKTSMASMNPDKFDKNVTHGKHYQYMYNALQRNSTYLDSIGNPFFSDIAQMTGTSRTEWSWGPLIADFDNDGLKDIFITNGIKKDFRNKDFLISLQYYMLNNRNAFVDPNKIDFLLGKMPSKASKNFFYKNTADLTFVNTSDAWVLDAVETFSNGAAYSDLDNDGDLDIVVNNVDTKAFIYQNNTANIQARNFLKVKLVGPNKNRLAIGARVKIKTATGEQTLEQNLTRGFQSSVSPILHFGLGKDTKINEIEIVWPDDKTQIIDNLSVNNTLVVNYEDASLVKDRYQKKSNKYFEDITVESDIVHRHTENEFDDFERESLLPHKMSQFGPALAVGDINEDNLDDFFVGGALGYEGKIYTQNSDGTFRSTNSNFLSLYKDYEDVDAIFFDADGDGDQDLYVVSGGNENEVGSPLYKDRLYENKNGTFELSVTALPDIRESGSCVKPFDYDQDGDLDLFVGGRQIPGKYPLPANSYILENISTTNQIRFRDKTDEIAPELKKLGMITDATWGDIDNDGFSDLLLSGEWMPLTFLKYKNGRFEKLGKETGLDDNVGWWYSINAEDFDNDGDLDVIAGNLGLNYKYKATQEAPFEIYTADFDKSGDLDIVLSFQQNGSSFPLRGRECSSNQMPFIKKKYPTYDAFGKATLLEVYGETNLKKSTRYTATNFATSYFENRGDGTFTIKSLPNLVQISSVNDIQIDDYNQDGYKDLLLAGNLYGSEIETPRNDASYGAFLIGDGKGEFTPVSSNSSGFNIKGNINSLKTIQLAKGGKGILIAKNNDFLQLIRCNSDAQMIKR